MVAANTAVEASAHAKINLHLGCADVRDDGYHDLVTVFQSVDLQDSITLRASAKTAVDAARPVASMEVSQTVPGEVPVGPDNLAWRAVEAVAQKFAARYGSAPVPELIVELAKSIPIAGGMAGGSADAAGALVAASRVFSEVYGEEELSRAELHRIAVSLGADVPFTLMGGTALGTGRGDELATALSRGRFHWAVVTSHSGLSTPRVFSKLDEMRAADPDSPQLQPHLDASAVTSALARGDQDALAAALHNDLQPAALSLRPDLRTVLAVGEREGALKGIVSGSGPTCVFLTESPDHAADLAHAVAADVKGARGFVTAGPAEGARLVDTE